MTILKVIAGKRGVEGEYDVSSGNNVARPGLQAGTDQKVNRESVFEPDLTTFFSHNRLHVKMSSENIRVVLEAKQIKPNFFRNGRHDVHVISDI